MKSFIVDPAEALCGAIFIGLGVAFAWQSYELDIGTAFRMGPGYFPLLLALVLVVLGASSSCDPRVSKVRPLAPSPGVAFSSFFLHRYFWLHGPGAGFRSGAVFSALIASFASHKMSPVMAVLLSIGITIFSVAVFNYGLGLPFQRFGPWLKF